MNLMKNKFTILTQKKLKNLLKKNLSKTPLIKNQIQGQKNNTGKNNTGKITIQHKGGGHKKKIQKN
jgi:ribosomal protein L2